MFFCGVIAWAAFDTVVAVTSTEDFCANACHSMREYIEPEWANSVHYKNRTGVRAACADRSLSRRSFAVSRRKNVT